MASAKDLSYPGQGPHNKALKTVLTTVPDLVREPWTQCATIQSHTSQLKVSRLFREGRCLIPLQDVPQCPLGREAGHPVYLLGWFLWCQSPSYASHMGKGLGMRMGDSYAHTWMKRFCPWLLFLAIT